MLQEYLKGNDSSACRRVGMEQPDGLAGLSISRSYGEPVEWAEPKLHCTGN